MLVGKHVQLLRRSGRVAEGGRLESVYTSNGIGGSNPPSSEKYNNEEGG